MKHHFISRAFKNLPALAFGKAHLKTALTNQPLATVTRRVYCGKLLLTVNMPRRCVDSTSKSEAQYPQSLEGVVVFFTFPKPKDQG